MYTLRYPTKFLLYLSPFPPKLGGRATYMETHPKDDVRRAPTLANHNGIVKSVPQKRNTFIYNKT